MKITFFHLKKYFLRGRGVVISISFNVLVIYFIMFSNLETIGLIVLLSGLV